MSAPRDAVIVGGGINGLVCAAFLAKAGLKPLVLEKQAAPGGAAATTEIAPGFRVPRFAHGTGPLRQDVVEELQLVSRGLQFAASPVDVSALDPAGGALPIYTDPSRTAGLLRPRSARDADQWPAFVRARTALGRVIGTLFPITPPSVDDAGPKDLWNLLRTARAFRALDRQDAYRLLRWGPMAAADLVAECFETELLRAAVAADGIFGTMFGPWSAGSGMTLLLAAANDAVAMPGSRFVRGGPGRLADVLSDVVRASGGEIRTGATVTRVLVRDDRARGVVLETGEEIEARAVVSGLDPRRTFLDLCDPMDLSPEFLWRMRNYRAQGTVAKVNLALSALPAFRGVDAEALTGRLRIGPSIDYLERAFDHAKYGRFSDAPWMEVTIPSLLDPSLAPPGAHVASVYVQFAPYALRDGGGWAAASDRLRDVVLDRLEDYAPGLKGSIVAGEILTPVDLERELGLSGGHIFHGELALDQLLTMRPLLGWGQYRSPIDGLYLCGSGTHPGTGLTGGSGANAARAIAGDLR